MNKKESLVHIQVDEKLASIIKMCATVDQVPLYEKVNEMISFYLKENPHERQRILEIIGKK
ncbi:MAG: hypothetical protein HOG49_21400 [Candidatus Scalindua sp.]|jgi:type III secretion system FlhB-like substrate exporter|nr:hypothetical protein [Candidatus Scalindua sp.]